MTPVAAKALEDEIVKMIATAARRWLKERGLLQRNVNSIVLPPQETIGTKLRIP